MTEVENGEELSPLESYINFTHAELEQVRTEMTEIGLLVEQSQGEVDKLAQRNDSIIATLHQIQANFDTIPREDIRSTYEAFQDVQQRLFTMRGQLEKLQSDESHLHRLEEFLVKTLQLLEGRPSLDIGGSGSKGATGIQQIIEAQEEERRILSRQIHDGPAQALSNFILQTEIAMRLFETDQERAREELSSLKTAAASTFGQVRDFIFDLRPMMLDDLGLVPTVRRYSEAVKEKTGLDINFVITGNERRIEPHIEVLTFRAIQTLLKNIRDHAQATQAKVMLDMGERLIRVSVEDNGRGFDPDTQSKEEAKKYGLPTLKDRIDKVGGSLDVESAAGEGTRIAFTIPTNK
jgi:two-component system sensor histidine kinase DegS